MEYINIETFLAIVETRSLSKAAEKLFLSQSTVSYRLNVLEREIGAELVHREKGKSFITLSPKGEEFISFAHRWVSLIKDTDAWKAQRPIHKLNVGCVDSLNTCLFFELYRDIMRNDSSLIINASSHWTVTIHKMVENHELDVGFGLWQIPAQNIVSKPLFKERMVIIAAERCGFSPRVHPKELDTTKEIMLYGGPLLKAWRNNLWHDGNREATTVDTVSLLSALVSESDFWSIVPLSVAKKIGAGKPLTISEIIDPPPERTCFQIRNKYPSPNKLESLDFFESSLESFLCSEFFISRIH